MCGKVGVLDLLAGLPADLFDHWNKMFCSEIVDKLRLFRRQTCLMKLGVDCRIGRDQFVRCIDCVLVCRLRLAEGTLEPMTATRVVVVRHRHHCAQLLLKFEIGLEQRLGAESTEVRVPKLLRDVGRARNDRVLFRIDRLSLVLSVVWYVAINRIAHDVDQNLPAVSERLRRRCLSSFGRQRLITHLRIPICWHDSLVFLWSAATSIDHRQDMGGD